MKTRTIFIFFIVVLLMLIPVVSAEIIVFDKYDTSMKYEDGKLLVTKNLRLKNIGTNPIIPGEVHFKISKDDGGKTVAPEVSSFTVTNKFGKELDTRLVTSDTEVDLVFTVWDPLLPEFFYEMTMVYELDFKPKGILFYQIALPEERTTIPIKKAKTELVLPNKYSITHAPDGNFENTDDVNSVSWEEKGAFQVEYSVIPFPRLGIKGSNVFWIIIILIFLVNLIVRLRKKAKMVQ